MNSSPHFDSVLSPDSLGDLDDPPNSGRDSTLSNDSPLQTTRTNVSQDISSEMSCEDSPNIANLQDIIYSIKKSISDSYIAASFGLSNTIGVVSIDVKELEKESERLIHKAAKMKKNPSGSSTGTAMSDVSDHPSPKAQQTHFSFNTLSPTGEVKAISSKPTSSKLRTPKVDFLYWFRAWKDKKRECKIQNLYRSLFPKLNDASERLRLWLDNVSFKKKRAIEDACKLHHEMNAAVDICQSQIDVYDDIFNDCLQIGLDLKKEISELKVSLLFGKEVIESRSVVKKPQDNGSAESHPIHLYHHPYSRYHTPTRHRHHRDHHKSHVSQTVPSICDSEMAATEPAVWHGYHGHEGKTVHFAKSPSIASLVIPNKGSIIDSQYTPPTFDVDPITIASSFSRKQIRDGSLSPERSPFNDSPKRGSSPEHKPIKAFISSVFNSSSSDPLLKQRDTPIDLKNNRADYKQKLSITSLIPRRKSGSSSNIENFFQSDAPKTSRRSQSTKARPATSSLPSSSRPSSIRSSICSSNTMLVEFNTNACTRELDSIFQESSDLAKKFGDEAITDISRRMMQLKNIKEAISKLILEVNIARESAKLNKSNCRRIRDELESLVKTHQCDERKIDALCYEHETPRNTTGTTSAIADDSVSPRFHSSLKDSLRLNLPNTEYTSDDYQHSPNSARFFYELSHCGVDMKSEDEEKVVSTKAINLDETKKSAGNGRATSNDSSDSHFFSSLTAASTASATTATVADLSSDDASQFLGELKSLLGEENDVKAKLDIVTNLIVTTSKICETYK